MMLNKRHEAGFGVVELLVVVVVVLAVGSAGWLFYSHNHKGLSSDKTLPSSQSSTKSLASDGAQPAQSAEKYLSVKEWSIQFPLSDTIKDAYYTVAGSNMGTDGEPNTAWVSLTSLDSSGCNISDTGPSLTANPVGSIIRVAPKDRDPVSGELYTQQYPDGVAIADYYYAYKPWKNNTCASASTLKNVNTEFASAAKAARATQQ